MKNLIKQTIAAACLMCLAQITVGHNGRHTAMEADRGSFAPESKDAISPRVFPGTRSLTGLPPGFTAEVLPIDAFSATDQKPFITGFTFTPQGAMLVMLQGGMVLVYNDATQQGVPFIDLSAEINHDLDRGLLGIAVQPGFALGTTQNWVYLLYVVSSNYGDDTAYDNSPGNYGFGRLTRYRAISDSDGNIVADLDSRQVLLGNVSTDGTLQEGGIANLTNTHSMGSLCFAADGSLIVSAGDGASYIFADYGGNDSCGFQCGSNIGPYKNMLWEDVGAYRAQELRSLAGKVLRINPETGNGYNSNPFSSVVGFDLSRNESRVWALGLRNPFRISIEPGTGSIDPAAGKPGNIFIGDVGWYDWEEINISQHGGENFGWPVMEGNYRNLPYSATLPGGAVSKGRYTGPLFSWPRNHSKDSEPAGFVAERTTTGTSVTGGVHYQGLNYPPEFRGAYFFGDYTGSWIRTLRTTDAGGTVTLAAVSSVFGAESEHLSGAVDFDADPVTGDVYFSALGQIYHIRFGSPIAVITSDKYFGVGLPLRIAFSAAQSRGEGPLEYLWDFGDGSALDASRDPVHFYTASGVYDVKLRVVSGTQASEATKRVYVGNTPPEARIVSPPADFWFTDAGSTITLFGTAKDLQDSAQQLSYRWVVDLGHNSHIHPGGAFNEAGSDRTQFNADLSDHGPSTDTFYFRVNFQVTDRGGMTTTANSMVYNVEQIPADCSRALLIPADGRVYTVGGNLAAARTGGIWLACDIAPGNYGISGLRQGGEVEILSGSCGNLSPIFDSNIRPNLGPTGFDVSYYASQGQRIFLRYSNFEVNSPLSLKVHKKGDIRTAACDWSMYE